MSGLTITRPNLTEYQKKMLYGPERFTVTEAATKCGKTFSHLWWLFEMACGSNRNGANYWWVAPVYGQAKIAFERLKRVVGGSPLFKVNESSLTVKCPNGAIIQFKSAEKPDNLYGEDVYGIVFDEFTRARESAWHALRSTITATGGKIKLIGNAKGKKNWGFKLGMKARSGQPGYAYNRVTAYDAAAAGLMTKDGRPLIEEIEQAKLDLPEAVFNELYLAEPQEDGSNPFGYDYIRKQVRPLSKKPPVWFGVDLAKRHDWTVIVGLDEDGNVCYFERFQNDWTMTTAKVIKAIGNRNAIIDSTGVGDPIVELVQKQCSNVEGLNYATGTRTKQQLMEALAVALQGGTLGTLSGVMQEELEAFEFIFTRTGVTYSAPEGFFDDCVNALALAQRCRLQYVPYKRPRSSVGSVRT